MKVGKCKFGPTWEFKELKLLSEVVVRRLNILALVYGSQ